MAVLGILVAYALPAYQDATLRAREAVLKEDLQRMRDSLEQYLTDKGVYPEVLDDLVRDGYLRSLPVDPLTGSEDTWETEIAPWMMTDLGQPAGIWNVFSGADGEGLNGVPYKDLVDPASRPDYPVIDVGTDPFIKEERYVMRQKRAKVKGWQPDIKWAVENALARRDRGLIMGAKRTFDLAELSKGFQSWKERAKKIKADRAAKIEKVYEEHKSKG